MPTKKKRTIKNISKPSSFVPSTSSFVPPNVFGFTQNTDSFQKKVPEKNENDVEITTKIYPTTYRNSKGFQVGNIKAKLDTKNAPFAISDQVNHLLEELQSYIQWVSTKKDPKDETIADMEKNIHDFFKTKKIVHVFSPKVIVGKGKKQTKKKRMKGGKSKTTKRKMKVQKGGDTYNEDKEIKKHICDAIEVGLIDQFGRVLDAYPEYADYALQEIYKTKTEPYSDDIEEMIVEAKDVLCKNKDKDN